LQKDNKMNWQDYIYTNAEILGGKPIVKGIRLSVEFLLGRIWEGICGGENDDKHTKLKKNGTINRTKYCRFS
jgi:hypothetical protein